MSDFGEKIKETQKSVGKVMTGRTLADFLLRNWFMALLLVVLVVLHINSRYDYMGKVEKIGELRKETKDLQIRQNILSSELMKTTLETNIIDRVNAKKLGLSVADTSLIIIHKISK